jgi:integrase
VQKTVQKATEDKIYSNFLHSLKSAKTKEIYNHALKQFMKFHHIENYTSLLAASNIEDKIQDYIISVVNRQLSTSFIKIFLASIKNFFEMNDIENIRWRKLKRFMGEETPVHEDRCYRYEEIQTLINAADMKLKAVILLMASSGMRVGALSVTRLGHLKRMHDLYKISVYEGQKGKGKYYTFCTPEAAKAIDSYLQFRERCGEKLTTDSPLFRKDFDIDFHEAARNQVIPSSYHSIRMDVFNCLIKSGVRTIDHVNSFRNRKEVKMTHGFRKFFETQLVNAKLHEIIIRKLTGHSERDNLTQLYSKQTVDELLQEYVKAIDNLTINDENRLKRKVEKLEVEKSQFDRLAAEIEALKKKIP